MFARGAGVMGVGWEALQLYAAATRAEVSHTANLLLAITLVLRLNIQDLRGALVRYVREHWDQLYHMDRTSKGLQYYLAQAARGNSSGLLAEAACQLCGVRIFLRSLGNGRMVLFGTTGPMYEILYTNGQFVAVHQGPAYQWSQMDVTDEQLHRGEFGRARQDHLDVSVTSATSLSSPNVSATGASSGINAAGCQSDVSATTARSVSTASSNMADVSIARPASSFSTPPSMMPQLAQPLEEDDDEAGIPTPSGNGASSLTPNARRQRRPQNQRQSARNQQHAQNAHQRHPVHRMSPVHQHHIPAYHPPEIGNIARHFAAELMEPVEPPYIVRPAGGITCGLPGCPVPQKAFASLSAWKRHVTLARQHLQNAFCTQCQHQLVLPVRATPAEIALLMSTHKRERCPLAAKSTMRERARNIIRLHAAGQDATHLCIPSTTDTPMEVDDNGPTAAAGSGAGSRILPRRMGTTEPERRAYICVDYAKYYKDMSSQSYRRIVTELDADLS